MRTLAAAVLVGVCALGAPRGAAAHFPVGVTTSTFTKTSVTTGASRPLATVIWYPAVHGTGTAETLGLRDAKVRHGRFPLVVFSHGSCGRPTEATYFTMALASLGFVVAAPPHPGNTADEIPACASTANFLDSAANRVPDVMFVIDSMLAEANDRSSRFSKRLRADAIGMSGLSFGGFTTLLVEQQDPRVRMALTMVPGGVEFLAPGDIALPTMVIGSEHDRVVGFAESQQAFARLSGPRFLVELLGGDHLNVVDTCAPLCGTLSQDDGHRLVLRYALPFFERYLGRKHRAGRTLEHQVDGVTLTADP
jgi:predicted dienelactone hydrolase